MPPPVCLGSWPGGRCRAGDAQGFLAVEGKSCLTLHALCVAADSVTGVRRPRSTWRSARPLIGSSGAWPQALRRGPARVSGEHDVEPAGGAELPATELGRPLRVECEP